MYLRRILENIIYYLFLGFSARKAKDKFFFGWVLSNIFWVMGFGIVEKSRWGS